MAEVELDCMGEACPVPLIKAEKALEKMAIGDILIVQIDHSCAMKNVPEWLVKRATTWNSMKLTMENGKSS